MQSGFLGLLLVLLYSFAVPLAATQVAEDLAPFHYINGQLVELDKGVKLYRLAELKPNTGYELRVSFPASIPAAVKFAVVGPPKATAAAGRWVGRSKHRGRRLLDCEKLIFSTDATGAVQGVVEPHVELRALRRSVHREGPTAGASQLVYNIVLAELVLFGLPRDSIPTVFTLVVVVLVAFIGALVFSNRLFPHLLNFLTSDTFSSGKSTYWPAAAAAATTAAAAKVSPVPGPGWSNTSAGRKSSSRRVAQS